MNEIQEYFQKKKDLHEALLSYIENYESREDDFNNLDKLVKEQDFFSDHEEFEHFLNLILNIYSNYHRTPDLINKIEKILLHYSNEIKQTFTNNEIFNIFISNKLILLFLFKTKILIVDESIVNIILEKSEPNGQKYCHFFLPEIKKFIEEEQMREIIKEQYYKNSDILKNYEKKRKLGQNDSYISTLIREDSAEEFITYVSQANIPLTSKIAPSIYETNSFLNENEPTLIEYSAFFGSIKIFNYLRMNKVELTPSLWLYAIHGLNTDIIHLLEENKVEQPQGESAFSCEKCLMESIRCHHNNITNYFEVTNEEISILKEEEEELNEIIETDKVRKNVDEYCFRYQNYAYFPESFDDSFLFFLMCKYKYTKVVDIFFKDKINDINEIVIKTNHTF